MLVVAAVACTILLLLLLDVVATVVVSIRFLIYQVLLYGNPCRISYKWCCSNTCVDAAAVVVVAAATAATTNIAPCCGFDLINYRSNHPRCYK